MIESAQLETPVEEAALAAPERKAEGRTRLISLDAFRGLAMTLMRGTYPQSFYLRALWNCARFL